ncbi:MAG: cysteine desulfurase NifS [Nitrospinota bacterium]|nr:MAG: cysteine desulfurase NifS [Nitrospinota bacterium]
MREVYLDHNATTPVDPEVWEAMRPYLRERFGNPSSVHQWGREARLAVEEAREQVAALLGAADPQEIVFTSSGSEADNLALKGIALANQERGNHIITSQIEHSAIIKTCHSLEKLGFRVTYLPVDRDGLVDPEAVRAAITDQTILISIMHANNEIGTIQPIEEIGAIAREHGIPFHTDAVQTVGKLPLTVRSLPIDLLSLSGHKLYAPKGIGALYIRRQSGVKMHSLISGGHQERSRRAGTENVPGIVALGKACEIARQEMATEVKRLEALRNKLEEGMLARIPHIRRNGHPVKRLPSTLHVSFLYIKGEALVVRLDLEGIGVSTGSACSTGSPEPSHVLTALGLTPEEIQGSVRWSLGKGNSEEDIDYVLEVLPPIVQQMREMSPLTPAI